MACGASFVYLQKKNLFENKTITGIEYLTHSRNSHTIFTKYAFCVFDNGKNLTLYFTIPSQMLSGFL
jgi:hypothetical protein